MLEIRNLTCGYAENFFIEDINFKVNAGEIVGIIGPNGSGKTTLLRGISRALKPKSGQVFLDGKDIWQMNFKELAKKMAVLPQSINPTSLSVEEFVLLGRIPHLKNLQFFEGKNDLVIVKDCLRLTDTLSLKNHLMTQISGGERQLVFIARALAQQPKLLLLDEPTTHLDITHQVRILDLIKRLNRDLGLTVIMVLHDLNLAAEYCRRLILLKDGRIFREGVTENVINYKTIEEVYKTVVVVEKNPVSAKPYVLLVSEDEIKQNLPDR
jgi:iron complex transport system ATP-binding protein